MKGRRRQWPQRLTTDKARGKMSAPPPPPPLLASTTAGEAKELSKTDDDVVDTAKNVVDDDNNNNNNDEPVYAVTDMTSAVVPKSRIPEIWDRFFQQMDQIDDLENRLDEHATRARRRTASLLEQTNTHRQSHVRMFMTHKYDSLTELWTLVVEGKLLIGHLDHQRAAMIDKEREEKSKSSSASAVSPKDGTSGNTATATTSTTATASAAGPSSSDRSKYRSIGEVEEEPIDPILFTHLFDKLIVVFRTIYQPIKAPGSGNTAATKKSTNRGSTKRKQAEMSKKKKKQDSDNVVNPKHLKSSQPTILTWDKNSKNAPSDAHAFFVNYHTNNNYEEPNKKPPPAGMKFHSVVASITLYPSRSAEKMYQPSKALADQFFPKHKNEISTGESSSASKKRKTDNKEGGGGSAGVDAIISDTSIPLANEIVDVPALLTMDEIIMAIYQYISDNKLTQDPKDKSQISCDKILSNLFDCDSFNFAELKQLLLSKGLIVAIEKSESPIQLKYVMNEKTVSPQTPMAVKQQKQQGAETSDDDDDENQPQVLSFDMDIWIPSLFHFRSRDLLRRIKRREFEYTSSRTKARYLLVASRGNEDIVKNKLEQAVSGRGYASENIPIFLALAKAAPPDSEARGSAQADAKICALVGRVEECSRKAEASWDLVKAFTCAGGVGGGGDGGGK